MAGGRTVLLTRLVQSLVSGIADTQESWTSWLWLDAALLAVLLLFLRASGYQW